MGYDPPGEGRAAAADLVEDTKVAPAQAPPQLTRHDHRDLTTAVQGAIDDTKRPGRPPTGAGFVEGPLTPINHGNSAAAVATAKGKAASANSARKTTGSMAQASEPAPLPKFVQQQRSDRLVAFLATLVTYPFMFLLTKSATTASLNRISAVMGGGGIDTRKRLSDFPEGEALLELESWCRAPVYTSFMTEWVTKLALLIRQLILAFLPHPVVFQVMNHPWVLRNLQITPQRSLQHTLSDHLPRAQQLLDQASPHVALCELQVLVDPLLMSFKHHLEQRISLRRGPTPLERLDFLTRLARTGCRLFFAWLRGLARLCTYVSSLLSVVSGALSFTVVPSIILSLFSALLGMGQLLLMGTADLLEPAVNTLLALTETGKDKAAALGGSPESSPVGSRVLPASTVEQLEQFFDRQLKQESGLLNRPEIPHLASLNRPLLVKAYDLGFVDAKGKTESRVIGDMLAAAQRKNLSAVLLRGVGRAATAAASFDASGVLTVLQQTVEGASGSLLPGFLGGNKASLKQLFRPDGFFAYADDRQTQVAIVLLARLLSWLHLTQAVCPGSRECLRFVLLLGERQAGKVTLFTRLVDAPAEYAGQLGGSAHGLDGTTDMGGENPKTADTRQLTPPATRDTSSNRVPSTMNGVALAPAVDMQQLAGHPNTYVVCMPGLHSSEQATSNKAKRLAATLGGLASAVVFLVHPESEPSSSKLHLLIPALAAGCHCLISINGPSRVKGLSVTGLGSKPTLTDKTSASISGGALSAGGSTPLEYLRSRWQSAAEALCALHSLNPSLLGVIVSEMMDPEGAVELPAGVQHFKQVKDWINVTAGQSHRAV